MNIYSPCCLSLRYCMLFVCAFLLMSASAQAQEVFYDPDSPGTVIRIENLPVFFDAGEVEVYNVDFRYTTGFIVYGQKLNEFDFSGLNVEGEGFAAMRAINEALNDQNPVPDTAGIPSQTIYYIGLEEEREGEADGVIAAIGSEFGGSEGWNTCGEPSCLTDGTTLISGLEQVTYADFTKVEGSGDQAPIADAGGLYSDGVGVSVEFDGSASYDPDGSIVYWEWDFGDGQYGVGETVIHSYDSEGINNVTLTVFDDDGTQDSDSTVAIIGLSPPSVDIGSFPNLIDVGDVNNNGTTDIAVLREGSTLLDIRDGDTGGLLSRIEYLDDGFVPITSEVISDSDNNGVAEVAVLAERVSDGGIVVEIRNIMGAQSPRRIGFRAGQRPVMLKVIEEDADGNGVPELAVLSVRNSDGRGLVEIKNAFGNTNANSLWIGEGLSSVDLAIVPDADSNDVAEIAVLTLRDSDERIVVEVRNAAGATNLKKLFFREGNSPIDIEVLADKEDDGEPELAVLSRRRSDGRNAVESRNIYGAAALTTLWFEEGSIALDLEAVDDADGNGVPEVAVLSRRVSDKRLLGEIKNAAGSTNAIKFFYPDGYVAADLTILDDLDGNGVPEAGGLLIRTIDRQFLVNTVNASGPTSPTNYWFSQ